MPSHQQVRQAIFAQVPGFSFPQKFLLASAHILRFGLLLGRKVRVWGKKENTIPLALGSTLDAALGMRPSVQKIAQIVFGSLSIIRCGEDLAQINQLVHKVKRCFRGREYVIVKKDVWPSSSSQGRRRLLFYERFKWIRYFYSEQVKLAFVSIAQIFKQLALLSLHLSDAYSAYTDHHVSEIFVYAKDLWNSLTSENAVLVKELKRTRHVTNGMLAKNGSSWTTELFLSLFLVPARLSQKLPCARDAAASVRRGFEAAVIRIDAVSEEIKGRYSRVLENTMGVLNVPRVLVPNSQNDYLIFTRGGSDDPHFMRFIPPPKKNSE
jgi:hypothetical protein